MVFILVILGGREGGREGGSEGGSEGAEGGRESCTYGVPQCAARTSLIGTTLAKLSKQLRNITYRQLFNKHTILSCLFLKMVVYCNKQLCK